MVPVTSWPPVGHSSGKIAIAVDLVTPEEAIKIAFFRGQAAKQHTPENTLDMLVVGMSAEYIQNYIDIDDDLVQSACFNSPWWSLTFSGAVQALERLRDRLQAKSQFTRILQVNLAYHSTYMDDIGDRYQSMLQSHHVRYREGDGDVAMFSSVTGKR